METILTAQQKAQLKNSIIEEIHLKQNSILDNETSAKELTINTPDPLDKASAMTQHQIYISLNNTLISDIVKLRKALVRMQSGDYGWCEQCGDDISIERLESQLAAIKCSDCVEFANSDKRSVAA